MLPFLSRTKHFSYIKCCLYLFSILYSLICTDFPADSICSLSSTRMVNADKGHAPMPLFGHVMPPLTLFSSSKPLPRLPLPATIKIKMSGLLKFKRFTLRGQKAFLSLSLSPSLPTSLVFVCLLHLFWARKIEDNDGRAAAPE